MNGTAEGGAQAKFMDRNLGALAATTAKPAAADAYKYFGVLYQHGRPTPFSGQGTGVTINIPTVIYNGAATKITNPSGSVKDIGGYMATNSAVSSVTSAIQTPNTYYYLNNGGWQWFSVDISLWSDYGTNKSIYDPCPYGYRVPKSGDGALSSWYRFSVTPTGQSSAVEAGSTWSSTWWPAAGLRDGNSGSIGNVGSYGWYWSSSRYPSAYQSSNLYFDYSGDVNPSYGSSRSYGFTVRCVQEGGAISSPAPQPQSSAVL